MYTVIDYTPKDIFVAYMVIVASCALLYPIARLLYSAIERGVSRWR